MSANISAELPVIFLSPRVVSLEWGQRLRSPRGVASSQLQHNAMLRRRLANGRTVT
jgi:hypothetical protein